jgi:hypothetical protein
MRRIARGLCAALLFFALALACAPPIRPIPRPRPEPLPPLPVEQLGTGQRLVVTPGTGIRTRVTLTAVNQDVRTLLPALAAASGVNLVMGPDVRGTVTVHLVDVPADEALRAVIAAAGLSIDNPAALRPWGPTVFHQPPLNLNTATVEEIKARFNVSTKVAETIIAARPR